MKICAFSDMHGQLDFKVEPCDIVLIGGDIVPLNIQAYTTPSEIWFKEVFIPWCNNLPCEKVVFIAGNHDHFLMRHPDRMRLMLKENGDKVNYLDCEIFEYQGKTIFGTPWCKPFGRWAFMESYEVLQKDCWWADGTHIGNESLRKLVDAAKPSLNLFGHLHSCQHEKTEHNGTDVYCVSLLDENYKMVYKPLYLEI